jgi:hypothetical protein
MHRAGRALRAVSQSPGAAVRVLAQLPGVAWLLLWMAIQALPRRVPDLARMTRSTYVGERQRAAALALHQHAIAIRIEIGYYPNLNPAVPEYRPRKRLLLVL